MDMLQFSQRLAQPTEPTPLLVALQGLRGADLRQIHTLLRSGELSGWTEWPEVGARRRLITPP